MRGRAITNDWRISMAWAIAGNRATSGIDQRLMYDQSWRPATDGTINRSLPPSPDRTSNRGILWPIKRALVISCDGAYDQSWHPKTDGTINRGTQRSIARSIVASCDRSYDQSLLPTTDRTIIHGARRIGIVGSKFWTWTSTLLRLICRLPSPTTSATSRTSFLRFVYDSKLFLSQIRRNLVVSPRTTLLRLILPWRSPPTSATSRTSFLRFAHDSNIFRSQVGRNLVVSPVWLGLKIFNEN